MRKPTVLVVGGGFAGLNAVRRLAKRPLDVILLDAVNYNLFQPLLYQVATAVLSPRDIAEPLRALLRKHHNVRALLGEAIQLDLDRRRVVVADGAELTYDYLVLATGARHSYFGNPEWEVFAPGLKPLPDALEIRRRIFLAFELAERESDPTRRQALLTFVIVGGGPTGVELAGALAEITRNTLRQDFRTFDPRAARVVLLERGQRVLKTYPRDLSEAAERFLKQLGVDIRTNTGVTEITPDHVRIDDHEVLPTHTTLWAAGISASPLGRQLGVEVDRGGRVPVLPDLTVPGHPEVYVVGDLAVLTQADGTALPAVAPAAIQQGESAADNIWRSVQGRSRTPFRYVDRGTMAQIGRRRAVADLRVLHLTGPLAWLAVFLVHFSYLAGFENRLLVLVQWAGTYFSHERGARLITGPWHAGPLGHSQTPSQAPLAHSI